MKSSAVRRLAIASSLFTLLALFFASAGLLSRVTAAGGQGASRRARFAPLEARLNSTRASEFTSALSELSQLDEPGAYETWRIALNQSNPELQKAAWQAFNAVKSQLTRKTFIPQVVRLNATPDEIARVADAQGLEFTVWSTQPSGIVVAAPPYLVEKLRQQGFNPEVLYDSVADWQHAREQSDAQAQAVTPAYQTEAANRSTQVRVAVIDVSQAPTPMASHPAWQGDRENVLLKNGSLIAYLDIFTADSTASVNKHVEEHYTQRGAHLIGFYTTTEFSAAAPRLFGQDYSFDMQQAGGSKMALQKVRPTSQQYHTYDQAQSEFKALAAAHPELAAYITLGQSYEGRDIFALRITNNPTVEDASKPDVLITGCHHAREWISVESPIYFANQLINNYGTDSFVRQTLDNTQIWIVPIVNPDGFVYSQTGPNDPQNSARLWRKSRRPISFGSCASGVGVDLNRNYDYQWRLAGDNACTDYCSFDKNCLIDDLGGSDDPSDLEVYRGPQAASEPEIKVMQSLISDPQRHFRTELDYHNFDQLILYPWGYQTDAAPDTALLSQLAKQMSDAIKKVNGLFYKPEASIKLYLSTGSSTDYAYGAGHVAVPFTIEMRPLCCNFSVPEDQIPDANAENWAGAQAIMKWAIGPPILESVKAYSPDDNGVFSKLVYWAHWAPATGDPNNARQPVIEVRFPGIATGPLQVRLQFSKTMGTDNPPHATLGRGTQTNELTFISLRQDEGWQRTLYDNDTWVGETVVIQDSDLANSWHLYVAAMDAAGLNLDGKPATLANYVTGTGGWQGYEDANGEGTDGGTDATNVLAPTQRGDITTLFVASPTGGTQLAAGDNFTVVWTLPRQSGFQPSQQAIYLSTDDGISYLPIAENIPGNLEQYSLTVPNAATSNGRIRVVAIDDVLNAAIYADNPGAFIIGANVGANVDVSLVSAEKQSLSWTDTSANQALSGTLRLAINLRITNHGSTPIAHPFIGIAELNRNYVLLTRDSQTPPGVAALQTLNGGNPLGPGESVQAQLLMGLISKQKFNMSINVYGVPVGDAIGPAPPTMVWTGKPRSR